MADDYLVEVVLKAKNEAAEAFREVNAHLAETVAMAAATNEALKDLNETQRRHGETLKDHGSLLRFMAEDLSAAAMATSRLAESFESKLTPATKNNAAASSSAG